MTAGKMRHRIKLQNRTSEVNADGQKVLKDWRDVATVAANVTFPSSGESEEHRQLRTSVQAMVIIRWSPTVARIKTDWRFLYGGQAYEITSALDVEGTRQKITIQAEAKPGIT